MRLARLIIVGALCLEAAFAAPKNFVTLSGEAYFSVVVTRREATGVGFTHRDGVAFVDFSNMSEATRKEFGGYDEAAYIAAVDEKLRRAEAAKEKARADAEIAAAAERQRHEAEAVARLAAQAAAPAVASLPTKSSSGISERDYSARDYSAPRTPPPASSGRCAATTKKGMQCKRSAKPGSSYCWQHGG